MPHGTSEPDDGLTPQKIREAILAGAAEGAAERARQIFADTAAGLDEVTAMLKKLAAGTLPPVTVTGSAGLASAAAVAGTVIVKSAGAAAALSGEGTLGGPRVHAASAVLSGEGTLEIGPADVAAAAAELRTAGQPDVEKLAGRPPGQWTKPELVVNSLFVVAVGYWMLTAAEQQALANVAALVQAVVAVILYLQRGGDS
jgi:hypothetical protein